jgi:UDP-2-acetamido-3-amino-2,3-dideoxy-glucuronate N-acetyltransferase
MKVGIAGYGQAGRLLAAALHDVRQEIVQVGDLSADRLVDASTSHPGASTAPDPAPLCGDPSTDAVVIATPLPLRFALARAALGAGKHVLIHGPLAACSAEARELVDLAARRERTLLVGHPRLHCRGAARFRQLLEAPAAGALRALSAARSLSLAPRRVPDLLFDVVSHDLAFFAWLVGREPEWVDACARRSGVSGQVDALTLTLGYGGALRATVSVRRLGPAEPFGVEATAEHRRLRLEDPSAVKNVLTCELAPPGAGAAESQREVRFEDPLRALCQHFVDCAERGALPRVQPSAAAGVVRTLETAARCLAAPEPPGRAG